MAFYIPSNTKERFFIHELHQQSFPSRRKKNAQPSNYTDTKTRHQLNIHQILICYNFIIFTPSTRDYYGFAYLVNGSNEISIT